MSKVTTKSHSKTNIKLLTKDRKNIDSEIISK